MTGLRSFLDRLERAHPEPIVYVTKPVDPARFEDTEFAQEESPRIEE